MDEEHRISLIKDDIDFNNGEVPKFHLESIPETTKQEDAEYESCQNELIEI